MKKKLLIALMAIIAAFCLSFGFTACFSAADKGTTDGDNTQQGGNVQNPDNDNQKPDDGTDKTVNVESVSLNKTVHTFAVGDSYTLIATVLPTDATDKSVIWSSSDDDIVTVSNGKLTAIAEGTATVIVTTKDGKKTAQCEITVKKSAVLVESVSLDETSLTLQYGDNVTLTATVLPADADNKCVLWSSSDKNIVTVIDGKITAVDSGKATITATTEDGNKTAKCEITVKGLKFAEKKVNGAIVAYSVTGLGTITDNDIIIPDNHMGKPVTAVAPFAFFGCKNITGITIPDTVTYVGAYAFEGCGIKSATIPSALISAIPQTDLKTVEITSGNHIEPEAFKDCTTLINVTLHDDLQHIGDYVFSGCTALTSLTVGNNLKSFGDYAVENCGKLQLKEYNNALYLGNTAHPYTVLIKAKSTSITSCNVNENTKLIYGLAFDGCGNLVNLTVPDSVIFVGTSAFNDCGSLKYNVYSHTYYLGNSSNPYVVMKGFEPKWVSIPHKNTKIIYSNLYHSRLLSTSNLIIPDGVTCIGKYAFGDTSGFKITMPDSVTYIGEGAFYPHDKVGNSPKEINIPANLTYICASTFSDIKLSDVTIPEGVTYIGDKAFGGNSTLTSINIPDSVVTIGAEAFSGCGITSINIPDSVTSIGASAFYNCIALESVTIGDSLISIGARAFSGCSKLSQFNIPDSVQNIDEYAFSGCSDLTKTENGIKYINKWIVGYDDTATTATIENGTKNIANRALEKCSFESITIPGSIEIIGYGAFHRSEALTSVVLQNGVKIIDTAAFLACRKLQSITIPASVVKIGKAFTSCNTLTDIHFGGTKAEWNAIVKTDGWDNATGNYTVHCIDGDIAKQN